MFKKIAIDGFRGAHGLVIEDFRRVNVLVGPNGGGKTSVLEALCLASQPAALHLVDKINQWRDMPPLGSQTWHTLLTLFSGMDWHRNVSLEMETEQETASVTISVLPGRGGTDESAPVQGTTTTTPGDPGSLSAGFEESVRGLKSVYRPSSGEEVEAVLELVATGYQQTARTTGKQPPRGPVPGCFFVHARRATSLGETAAALTELYAKNAEGSFVGALRKVEPRVRRLVPGVRGKQPTVLADLARAHQRAGRRLLSCQPDRHRDRLGAERQASFGR
ncbi:MAG: AAA family ATPase [Thermoguttaceae bacterium]|nr:AAA family ATPase [Thermoguttaceae bacterium]